MSESRQTHVTLHDIDPQALDQLVQFAYTAEIVVGEGNVQVRPPHPSRPVPHLVSGPQLSFYPQGHFCLYLTLFPQFSLPVSLSLLPRSSLLPRPTDSAPSRQPSAAERRP